MGSHPPHPLHLDHASTDLDIVCPEVVIVVVVVVVVLIIKAGAAALAAILPTAITSCGCFSMTCEGDGGGGGDDQEDDDLLTMIKYNAPTHTNPNPTVLSYHSRFHESKSPIVSIPVL